MGVRVRDAFKFGVGETLGSLAVMSILGVIVLSGVLLLVKAQSDEPKNQSMMAAGICLILVGSLPFLPLLLLMES